MAIARLPRYTDHPLSWERTDLGRPLMRLALLLLALLLIGSALAVLFSALTNVGAEAQLSQSSGFEGEGPLVFFALLFTLTFYFPFCLPGIFIASLPILGGILAFKRWGESERRMPRGITPQRESTLFGFLGK
jgi:hypothetical protein